MARTAKKVVDEKEAVDKLQPVAKLLGKAAGQVWKIFVMRYVAKGISELFAAAVIIWVTTDKLYANYWLWWLIPFAISVILAFDAIQLLVNPYYFAMDDVEKTLKRATSKTNEVTIYNNR